MTNITNTLTAGLSERILKAPQLNKEIAEQVHQHLQSAAAFSYATCPGDLQTRLGLLRHRAEELQAERLDAIEKRNEAPYGGRRYYEAEATIEEIEEAIQNLLRAGLILKTCKQPACDIETYLNADHKSASAMDDGVEEAIAAVLS